MPAQPVPTWRVLARPPHSARLPRVAKHCGQAPGTLHHIIVRGIEKKEIVTDNTNRKNFITRLGTLVTDTGMEVYSWALVSQHQQYQNW
jgi:hypothetical protein